MTPGFGPRLASAIVLVPITLFCVARGGWPLWILLALAGGACVAEWLRLWARSRATAVLPLKTGLLALGGAWAALAWLRCAPHGLANVLFLLSVVWATDSLAYATGRLLGGPKLARSISPGKTWSGAAGGLAGAVAVAELFLLWRAAPVKAGLVAALLSVISQAGDLLESGCKRRAGLKDSGWLIPGHGGMLDRLDGLLAAAPAAALLVWIGGQNEGLWWS